MTLDKAARPRCPSMLYEMPLGSWNATWIGVRFRCLLNKGHEEHHRWWSNDALLHLEWIGNGPTRPDAMEARRG